MLSIREEMVFWYKSCTTLKTEPLFSGKCYSCSEIRDRDPIKMQAIFIALKINEKLKRKMQAQNVLIYQFFSVPAQHSIGHRPLLHSTSSYQSTFHFCASSQIIISCKMLAVVCLLPSSMKWHWRHTVLCMSLKFLKDINKALVATANDIWLPLITRGFFSPMKRSSALAEKSQKN